MQVRKDIDENYRSKMRSMAAGFICVGSKDDALVKSSYSVIPAKAGQAVKRQRYPEVFDSTGPRPSPGDDVR